MNDQSTPPENIEPASAMKETPPLPDQQQPERKTGLAGMLARVNLTQWVLVLLAVAFLWQWQSGQRAIGDMQQQLARKIAEMDGNSKANQLLLAQSQEQVRELAAKMAPLESHTDESRSQRAALEALYADMSVSRDESALAEVEQMLMTAAQQLQLSANVKVAMIAMQSADARLQRMNRPAFNGLRRAIGQDMDKLRALPNVDMAGLGYQLDNLMAAVDKLPLAYQKRPVSPPAAQVVPQKEENFWQKLLREIGQEIKQLVRIENTGKEEIPLLPPNQEFFLRENLKLRLMAARLALMSRDEEIFSNELKTAQLWTARYFDGKSEEGARMLSGLKKLSAASIRIELPDIGQGLQAVRNYRLAHEHEPRGNYDSRPRVPR